MSHQRTRSTLVAALGFTLLLAACTSTTEDGPNTTVALSPIVEQTATTQSPATTTTWPTTTAAPATTSTTNAWDALPASVRAGDWHVGTYESVGYSCGSGNPDFQCDAPHRANFTTKLIGSEQGMDFIDFIGWYDPEAEPFPADSPYRDWSLVGRVDDSMNTKAGLGHGIRVTQLDRAPPGLDIGGEAWIRLTISSLSAMDRAEHNGRLVPTEIGYRIETGSEGDPLKVNAASRLEPTRWIGDVVLVATNSTMSQWIIAFNEPGTYTYTAGYWTGGFRFALNVRFVRL